MTIYFTDTEKEWIDKKPFNWTVKKNCPSNIKKELQRKINLLYRKDDYGESRFNKPQN